MAKTKAKTKIKTKTKAKAKALGRAKPGKARPVVAVINPQYLQIIINVWVDVKNNVLHVRHGGRIWIPSTATPAGGTQNDGGDLTLIAWNLVKVPGFDPGNCMLTGVTFDVVDGSFSQPVSSNGGATLTVVATNNQNGQDKSYKYQLLGQLNGKPINSPDPGIVFDGH